MSFLNARGEGATCGPAYHRGRALCAAPQLHIHQPDGLLTLGSEHDVGLNPHIIAPDPYASDECLDVSPSPGPISLTATTMGDDESPSGRLRPRKSLVRNLHTQTTSKSDSQVAPRRTSTPSKASPNKNNDLVNKSESSPTPHFLCQYCEKKFVSKQTVSKHAQRMHPAVFKQGSSIACLFCNHAEPNATTIIRHMVDCHPNQYFACLDCLTRFPSTTELDEHKLNVCEKQKKSYRSKLRHKVAQGIKKKKKSLKVKETHYKSEDPPEEPSFNGIVISCELKPSLEHNADDIEDNITTNLILPPSKTLGSSSALEKSAVIILDDIQWNKRIPPNFTFHNTDADQILSRLGVVHKSPRTGEPTKKDWFKSIDESTLKFEKCFDTTFYSKVSSNVQENLSKFLDGSFNFNPDPESVIKTRKSKKSVVINTAEGFPILLACEQYSRSIYDSYLPRSLAPRHKWIRDNIENERSLMNPDQIKRDSHVNNCIITLVSGLDIWTQLCMRRKYEDKNRCQTLEKKVEKRTNVRKELEDILESRELPSSSQVEKPKDKLIQSSQGLDFPASLGLVPSAPSYELQPAVLSGEWVRPRCYVCCACGAQTRDPKTLTSHIATRHPNAQVQHYEIVGEVLLNADILKHLYVPPSQMSNRTRPLRGFRDCTKCMKSISLEDLHQHMLDCAGDTPTVRRRHGRHRPFGVRRRRPRLADNTVRKKIRKDLRTRQRRQKNMIRSRQKIRTEVGDAETIRKMLADLPAKRHRVLVNPLNHMTRPRVKRENQKKKIMMKKRSSDDKNIKDASGSKDSTHAVKIETNNPRNVASKSNTNDDSKSLRSKRVVVKTPRQSQSVKSRNANMCRIKRKSIRLKEQQLGSNDAGISQDLQTTNDYSLKKINLRKTRYKTRKCANETGSNNRSEHRQGCSRSNSNSNNSVAPTQSVPLKHSIASLTANSETHDKSVQFHHLFLVQQECNNVNQHMPSEERKLFENEDVIVRFDKPPLNNCQKSSLDLQKNKMNKPRKGLNDCIAMLKHKLLDPLPSETTEHVSVQCGGDEPLDFDVSSSKETSTDNNESLLDNFSQSIDNYTKLSHEEQSANSTTINDITQENQNQKCLERVMVGKKGNDTELEKLSPKIVSEKVIFAQGPSDSSHKTVVGVCTELTMVSENSNTGNNNYVPSTMEETSSQNILNQDAFDDSSQIQSTSCSEFETTCKNNTCDYAHLSKRVSTNINHESILLSQKDMRVRTEMDLTQNSQVDIFSQPKEIENMPAVIPPAHASTNVAPMLTIPLDLSSNNQITSHKNCYSLENYDYYETLDLSNKTSYASKSVNNYDVVDLRVKASHPEYHQTIDLLKSGVDNTHNLRDLSDNMPTDLSVKGKGTDPRYEKYVRTPPIQDLSSHSKTIQECRYNPFASASQNCPTDLSGKVPERSSSKIEQGNVIPRDMEHSESPLNSVNMVNDALPISTLKISPQTVMLSSEDTVTQKDNKAYDYIPQLNLETAHTLNSNVCDHALVIPEKMKPTMTKQGKMPVKEICTESFDEYSCCSSKVPNVVTSSASLGPSTKMTVNVSIKSCDSIGKTSSSTIISRSMTAAAGTSLSTEVTGLNCTPLYTSSCSSAPKSTDETTTKVSLSSCQSIIGTTVVSSTTIYATSAEVSSNHKAHLEHKVMTVSQEHGKEKEAEDGSTEIERKSEKHSSVVASSDQDLETARKIAMLPKELVEIIGNMPADHRNQLLNVLPQYVSTSSVSSHNENEKVINLEPLDTGTTSQNEFIENKELSVQRTCSQTSQENLISKQNIPSPRCSDQIPQLSSHTVKQFSISPTNDKGQKSLFNAESDIISNDSVKEDKDLEDPYMALDSTKMKALSEYDKNRKNIIDLTDEESCVLSTDAVKAVQDLSDAVKLGTPDIDAFTPVEKPLRKKVNSDKTASLRAVRIKAPAERQKENQLLKRMSVEQQCKPNISDSEENEVNKSLESNTSLAIQQAEISSTQSNRNVQHNMNNEHEASGEDPHPPSTVETVIENKDNSHEAIIKTAVVTSSIPLNDTVPENSNEKHLNKTLSNDKVDKKSKDDTINKRSKKDPNTVETYNVTLKHKTFEPKQELTSRSTNLVMKPNKQGTEKSENLTATNEDDSEDDISLASIVKQKKYSMKKGDHVDILPDVMNAPPTKNDKEKGNHALQPEAFEGNSDRIMKKIKRTRKYKKSVCDSRVLAETANVVKNISKNKKRNIKLEPAAISMTDCTIDGKVKDAPLHENFKKIANNESSVVNIREQQNKHVVDRNEDIEKESWKYSTNDSNLSNSDDDILGNVQKENMNKSVGPNKKVGKSASEGKFNDHRTIKQVTVLNDEVSTGLSTVELENNTKEETNLEFPSHESKKNKKVKLSNALESTDKEVLKDRLKIDDNVSTPLRRSKRGKSLYIDNISDSVICNEPPVDHKTPLTKKQLIFSKLLLDDACLTKQIKNNQNEAVIDIKTAEINEDTVVNHQEKIISTSDFTTEISIEKAKGTKRKKKNQVKGKNKKKKPLDRCPGSNKSTDSISKSVIDTVSEPNIEMTDKLSIQKDSEKQVLSNYESEENKSNTVSAHDNSQKEKLITNLIEKRKSDPLTRFGAGHIVKAKKTKVQPTLENELVDQSIEVNTTLKDSFSAGTNIPVAARRTRSKSVIVKSTPSNLYDPYDIDFDDVSEKAEPFRKGLRQTKAINKINEDKEKSESDLKLTEKQISTYDVKTTCSVDTEKPKISTGKFKTDLLTISMKYDKIIDENICHCDAQNSKSKQESSVAVNQTRSINEDSSDSDDSSQSDVPLKKYLEEKDKRNAEKEDVTKIDTEPNKKDNPQKMIDVGAVSETEEQLRSEQFMESFGFFSERKPRKSNLLAAKKIAETFHNEKDDTHGSKQRMPKKVCPNENKRNSVQNPVQKPVNKIKKPKNTKSNITTEPCYCYVCKKSFFRPDNYLRHQMTLLHISKLSEFELKLPTNRIIEEPNYLVAFRDQIHRLKEVGMQLAAETKKKSRIKMPSLDVILEKVNIIIEKQKLKMRGLSTDQALFLDCCELLKESHMPEVVKQESILVINEMHDNLCSSVASLSAIDIMEKRNNDVNADSKSECDSITAKSILESEEVRNLENDLISGLKEAANINRRISKKIQAHKDDLPEIGNESFSIPHTEEHQMQLDHFDLEELELNKSKKQIQTKAKMYPDVEDIDIFEDKFDKIKRKCRSQAAAAKQTQSVMEASPGHKTRKRIERKKGKKALKKNYQNTVLTKGALKGFDGIKISPTSEINVPDANLSLPEVLPKKKKRKFSKRKREKKDSESSTKYDSDSRMREGSSSQRKHDVYEFMDNEDAELFEFRPSTLMERFKSMNSKEYHSKETSKLNTFIEDAGNTSESGSDEDDFVYMSDDYVCSDDETENSLLSCEITNLKSESRKNFTPPKRKDVVEKNAVMGKIFKHNAVRSDKKGIKAKELDKPKTNLDQLFDSLLEEEPVSSTINNEETSACLSESEGLQSKNSDSLHSHDVSHENKASSSSKMHDSSYLTEWGGPSVSKQGECDLLVEPSTSRSYLALKEPVNSSTPKVSKNDIETNEKTYDGNKESQDDFCNEAFDDTGVARQRARRKCTVGKQNVLAETWSSESEPDGVPIRSNSSESLVITASRKKKGRKREGNQSSGRRGNRSLSNKKQDSQSRVNCCRKISSSSATGNFASENLVEIATETRELDTKEHDRVDMQPPESATPSAAPTEQGPVVAKGQPRSATSYWSPGGATEQEHIQQHGWIVGDSHKKLVTMLAHAKGRKRHNDDERHLIE